MRDLWPVDLSDKLHANVAKADEATRHDRVQRMRFLGEEFGPPADMVLTGGIGAMFAIVELQRSFVNGNQMATILLCQSFMEHSLAGSFALSGHDQIVGQGFNPNSEVER